MFQELSAIQKRLLGSFFLFGLASPMVVVFSGTYLWRQDHNPLTLALFSIGNYIGISTGFLMNAKLLRVFGSGKLYALGCLLQGVVPMVLVALGAHASDFALLLGLTLGIAQGFFWANRNAITSKITEGPYRYRFISIETALATLAGILSPLLIGWFIVFGETFSSYTIEQAYQITSVIGFVLLIASARFAWSFELEPQDLSQIRLQHVSPVWNKQRLLEYINGIAGGMESVLPLIVILLFLGQEEAVGTVKSVTSLLSAIMIFLIGKRVRHSHHATLFKIWMLANTVGAIVFAIWYSPFAALIYFLFAGLVGSLRWSSFVTVMYEVIDRENMDKSSHRFLYLLDREICLNLGRITGLLMFIGIYLANPDFLIRFGFVMILMIQLFTLGLLEEQIQKIAQK